MIIVTSDISLCDDEVSIKFILASGPGGQNVNKVATAAQLRFDVRQSTSIADEVKDRLKRLAGNRMTSKGILIITARRHRTQEANRQDAINRLIDLIRKAAVRPKIRRKTQPSQAQKRQRLENKVRHGRKKQLRRSVSDW